MVTQRRLLRLLPCLGCGHFRATHYLVVVEEGRRRGRFVRPRGQVTPMPCHVLRCSCARYSGLSPSIYCPACHEAYAGRSSLEIHLYGTHPALSLRERSELLGLAVRLGKAGRPPAPEPGPIVAELVPTGEHEVVETELNST